jgi:hypothetical protein
MADQKPNMCGELVMRVVRVGTPPFVVRVRTRHDVVVAVPECLPPETVLSLARLVLSTAELSQLKQRLGLNSGGKPGAPKRRVG